MPAGRPGEQAWRQLSFEGRIALVTGGARGIGRAVACRLAGLGAETIIWDRDGSAAANTARELREGLRAGGKPADISHGAVDVTDWPAVEAATSDLSGLDVLVNNAGTTTVEDAASMPLEIWERTLRINLTGVYLCCRAAIPLLTAGRSAAVVNISSSSALVGGGGGVHYAASKAGVDGLTRHLARELAPSVRVNSIQPRTIDTDLFQARYAHDEAAREALLKTIPLQRAGQPEDVANAVAFLASDWAAYITGQILLIDGGRTYQ